MKNEEIAALTEWAENNPSAFYALMQILIGKEVVKESMLRIAVTFSEKENESILSSTTKD